jgi:hypothetical protein
MRRFSHAEVSALADAVARADLGEAGGTDLCVVSSGVAAAPRKDPPLELHVGRYPGAAPEVSPHVESDPDLPTELSMARAHGHALTGVPPAEAIGAVPDGWVRERARYWIARWLDLTGDTRHAAIMVLTACRMWCFLRRGRPLLQALAARWVLARDGSLTAVGEALRQRFIDPGAPVSEDGIRRLLKTIQRLT